MKKIVFISVILLFWSTSVIAEYLPQPPYFKAESNPMEILEQYPLGVLTKYAAKISHGDAHEILELPNGLTGWKYVVGGMPVETKYETPAGEKISVRGASGQHTTKTYILVFSNNVVVDVLFHDEDRNTHITALLAQLTKGPLFPTH